jgi:hypothetical protein
MTKEVNQKLKLWDFVEMDHGYNFVDKEKSIDDLWSLLKSAEARVVNMPWSDVSLEITLLFTNDEWDNLDLKVYSWYYDLEEYRTNCVFKVSKNRIEVWKFIELKWKMYFKEVLELLQSRRVGLNRVNLYTCLAHQDLPQ